MAANLPPGTPLGIKLTSKIWGAVVLPLVLRKTGAFSRRAADFFDIQLPASAKPVNGVASRDLVLQPETNLWVRIFSPPTEPSSPRLPVLFFFHGGFFAFSSPATVPFDRICRRIAEGGNCIVISVNYRRIPEHRYPAQIEDGFNAIKWFQANSTELDHADLSRCFLAGDSAGGNLVYNLTLKLGEAGGESLLPVVFRGQVLIQPAFGGETPTQSEARLEDVPFANRRFSDWRWRVYLPDGTDKDHVACNPFGNGCREMSETWFPPTLIVTGSHCPLQDRQRELVERMQAAGKEVETVLFQDGFHGFYLFPSHSQTVKCLEEVVKFIKARSSM